MSKRINLAARCKKAISRIALASMIALSGCTLIPKKDAAKTVYTNADHNIAIYSGNGQSTLTSTEFSAALVVMVTDKVGAPGYKIKVNWAVTSGSATLSDSSASTFQDGHSIVEITAGVTAGPVVVTATIDGTSKSVTFNLTVIQGPVAFTQNWPFDTVDILTKYTFDNTKINCAADSCNLLTVDQLDSDNTASGFGGGTPFGVIWDAGSSYLKLGSNGGCDGTASNCAAVAGAALSGSFVSRIIDVGVAATSAVWESLTWVTPLPYGKELPSGGMSEKVASYSAITPNMMSNNASLWHFNETAADTVAGGAFDFADSSGGTNHLTATAGVSYNQTGILNKSAYFNGAASASFSLTSVPTGATARTVSLWFKQNGAADQAIFSYGRLGIGHGVFEMALKNGSLIFSSEDDDTGDDIAAPYMDSTWHHAAVSWDGTKIRVYIDGAYAGQKAFALNTGTTFALVGSGGVYGAFRGYVDELAIWSRQLSDTEIAQLYLRGAAHINFQVRSCAMANCADGTFVGYSGAGSTYFSELNNSVIASPSMLFSMFGGLTISNNRYFQYQAIFDTIVAAAPTAPLLQTTTIGSSHYTGSQPIIANITPVSYLTLTSFVETLGPGSCTGLRYLVSGNGTTWYYWTGAAWAASNETYSQATTAATINTNIGTLVAAMGTGNFYWKAFLNSNGAAQCDITNVAVGGTH